MTRMMTFLLAFSLAAPLTAFAQSELAPRVAVAFAGGFASSASTTGVALGGAVLADVHDRAALEAQGTYLDRGTGASAFTATGSVLLNMVSKRERIVPYGAVGGGFYRATFDLESTNFFGPLAEQFASPGMGYQSVGHMADFYARRLGPVMPVGGFGAHPHRSFVDPATTIGGGLRFNVTGRLMIRPDVRAVTVFADRDTHTVGVLGVNVGYRF